MDEEQQADAERELPTREEAFVLSRFSECLNDTFRVQLGVDQHCELELVEAVALKHYPGAPREDPFSLLFRGPKEFNLPQGTYQVEHQKLGKFPLFLVPMMPDQDANYFESIFN